MADKEDEDPKTEGEGEVAEEAPKSKKGIMLGGGVAAAIGLAYVAFLMAVPSVEKEMALDGPFITQLTAEKVSVTLEGNDGKNFLGIQLRAEFSAYEEPYVADRIIDPLYQAQFDHGALLLLSGKTKEELEGTASKEVLCEELRDAIDPILFPIHFGATATPIEADPESGIRAGTSFDRATWRGLFYDHELHIDAPDRTIALNGGDKVPFSEGDRDVRLVDPSGDTLYVDVSGLMPEFVGTVNVGAMGKIRRIYFFEFITQ